MELMVFFFPNYQDVTPPGLIIDLYILLSIHLLLCEMYKICNSSGGMNRKKPIYKKCACNAVGMKEW
jgi:hypothetical protein